MDKETYRFNQILLNSEYAVVKGKIKREVKR